LSIASSVTIVSSTSHATSATALARQPIVDRSGACHGYELLFRGGPPPVVSAEDDRATASVLVAAACDIGWELLGGGRPLYLNVGAGLLFDSVLELTPPGVVVLEVLERVTVDELLLERLVELHDRGFTLALDDFVPDSRAEALVPQVDVVKVDVLEVPQARWPDVVASVHERGAVALAEKVANGSLEADWIKESRNPALSVDMLKAEVFESLLSDEARWVMRRELMAAPSLASGAGTQAMPMTCPSWREWRALVTCPIGSPRLSSTAAPSVGTSPSGSVKPTSAVSLGCSAACSSAHLPMKSSSLSSLTIHGMAAP